MEKYINPETGRFIVTIPKLKPKWVEILLLIIQQRDPSFSAEKAKEIVEAEWKNFHERGKERAPRKPKEKPTEPTQEERPEPQQAVDVNAISRFLRREFPALDKDQWKSSRHTKPRTRLLQNISNIDKVFRKCKLFPRSQPYRALHEIRKSLEEIIENVPQSEEIVQKKIVDGIDSNEALFDFDQEMECIEEDLIQNDPPPPTPSHRNREENDDDEATQQTSPMRYGYS